MPVAKLESGNWPHPARLPLGCGWSGQCTAPGHENQIPSQEVLEAFCNLGYATGCKWAPEQRTWDSVRFSVSAPLSVDRKDAASGSASRLLHLRYVCERNHLPVEDGELQFDLSRAACLRPHADARIQRMAECFLESYLSRART
jgi:hypothetical protein